jgi:hypothetical protein
VFGGARSGEGKEGPGQAILPGVTELFLTCISEWRGQNPSRGRLAKGFDLEIHKIKTGQ